MTQKLSSLSIFFPFYNDEGTVQLMINDAYTYGKMATKTLEVIAIHGGPSQDETWREIMLAKRRYPQLRIINKADNDQGYAVIKYGFEAARKDWVFYTDGDAQYQVKDLLKLVKKQFQTRADVINGIKIRRHDAIVRRVLGKSFEKLHKFLIRLPINDIHCDFRLIRTKYVKKITWETQEANIVSELIIKLQRQEASFAEVLVNHRHRVYGRSNYSWYTLTLESCQELFWSLKYTYLSQHKL